MAIHSSILAWRIPLDSGAWRATVHGVAESNTTKHSRNDAETYKISIYIFQIYICFYIYIYFLVYIVIVGILFNK